MGIPIQIAQAMYGFMYSSILFAGDELGIFDHLASEGTMTASALAAQVGLQPGPLERFLIAATALQLVEKMGDGYVMVEELRPYFLKSSPLYCGGLFPHFRDSSSLVFRYLKEGLIEGEPQWKRVVKSDAHQNQFDDLYEEESRLQNFVACMWAMSYPDEQELVQQFSFAPYRHLVDLGGCSGSFAIAALQANPHLTALVFDLAPVERFCLSKRAAFQLESRLNFQVGDLFKHDLPPADLYALGYILSDWSRADGTALLKKIYAALPSGGALLINEKLFNDQKTGPLATAMMNICMLLEQHGQHYSAEEYCTWLREIGFVNCQVFRSHGDKHMIVGVKAREVNYDPA